MGDEERMPKYYSFTPSQVEQLYNAANDYHQATARGSYVPYNANAVLWYLLNNPLKTEAWAKAVAAQIDTLGTFVNNPQWTTPRGADDPTTEVLMMNALIVIMRTCWDATHFDEASAAHGQSDNPPEETSRDTQG
ncbi:hypothetical protein [Streptomyces sp. 900105245]